MEKKDIKKEGQSFLGIQANPGVFIPSLLIVLVLVITTLVVGDPMADWFASAQDVISTNIGWVFILILNLLFVFSLFLGFGKYRNIRLGGDDAKPDFTLKGWFAMLFSAGMGIGLLFWSVAEPISHFNENPMIDALESSTLFLA